MLGLTTKANRDREDSKAREAVKASGREQMAASNAQCPEDVPSQSRSCRVSQGQGLSKAQDCDVADVAHLSFTLASSAPNSDQTSEPLAYTE